jgi:hypothetical protein
MATQSRIGWRPYINSVVSTILLDAYTGAAAAYSLRKLNSSYTGSAIRVRRSSDNTEQNIGFSSNGVLDTTALMSFVGVGSVMFTTWYDQSGNAKNAVQTTASNQPQVVINGVLVTQNGKPSVYFNQDILLINRIFSTSNFSVFALASGSSGQTDTTLLAQHNGTPDNGRTVFISPNNELAPYDKLKTFFNNGTSYSIKSDVSVFNGSMSLINVNSDGNGNVYQFVNSSMVGSLAGTSWTPLNTSTTIGNYLMNGTTTAYIGYIGEIVCYTTNKLTNRVAIESNINAYYSAYNQYSSVSTILDTYSAAAAAYSLRKLKSSYTGSAIRVRRSSDNTEQNIGFDTDGGLDTSALLSFVGSGNGFVTTWYDQSGNGKNALQTTASNQPFIVSAGSIYTLNGKPIIRNPNINIVRCMNVPLSTLQSRPVSIIAAGKIYQLPNNGFGNVTFYLGGDVNVGGGSRYEFGAANKFFIQRRDIADAVSIEEAGLGTNTFIQQGHFGSTQLTARLNGIDISRSITDVNQFSVNTNFVILGASSVASDFMANIGMYEYIFYFTDKTSDRQAIESNINSYYSIFDNIITSGLVLNLDSNKTTSYSGTGSNWYDISGNNNNVTLYNTTYYSTNGGNIYLNGTNAWGYGATSSSYNFGSGDFSIDFWTYFDASNGTDNIYKHTFMIGDSSNYVLLQKWRSGISNGLLLEYCVNGNRYCITPSGTDPQPRAGLSSYTLYNPISVWSHIVITVVSNVMYFYINGNLMNSISLGSRWSGNKPLYIGKGSMSTNEYHKGHISNIHIYKGKGLSATEILQNFNQTRARFGV